MKIPEFTAEMSLSRNTERYTARLDPRNLPDGKSIVPQRRILDCFCFRNWSYCCCRNEDGTWTCGKSMQA